MSDLLATPPDDDEDESSRSRAVWGLVALGILAVLVVVILFATSGSGGGGHNEAADTQGRSELPVGPSTPPAPSTPLSTSAVASTSASASASTRASTSAIPTSTANPCPAAKQCAVPGDAGQLIAAVNSFRTSHGAAAVPGTVSAQAQQCALAQGNGPSCEPSFAWEPVATQDGPKAVALVSPEWLLDPSMKSFSVGWAYAGGGYECAVLKLR